VIEVCISLKRYVRAVTLFAKYSGVKFEPTLTKESFKDRAVLRKMLNESNRRCIVPIGLHADLIQKLCVVLIHLEAHEMVQVRIVDCDNLCDVDVHSTRRNVRLIFFL
jgi:hypothetical protein